MVWKPGQSGNPNGQPPRTKIWREAIERAVKRRQSTDPLALEKLAEKLLKAVERGDINAMREFGDRLDGKVSQPMGGADDLPALNIQAIGWLTKTVSSESHTSQGPTFNLSMTDMTKESNELASLPPGSQERH